MPSYLPFNSQAKDITPTSLTIGVNLADSKQHRQNIGPAIVDLALRPLLWCLALVIMARVLLALFLQLSQCREVALLYSDSTPPLLKDLITEKFERVYLQGNSVAVVKTHISQLIGSAGGQEAAIAYLDATYSRVDSSLICALSEEISIPHLILGYCDTETTGSSSYCLSGTYQQLADAVSSLLRYFHWSRANLCIDSTATSVSLGERLQKADLLQFNPIGFFVESSVQQTVAREMRVSGNRVNVFLTSGQLTKQALKAQSRVQLAGAGFGNVLPLHSSLYQVEDSDSEAILRTGNVVIAEEELLGVRSEEEWFSAILEHALQLFMGYTDDTQFREKLNSIYPDRRRSGSFLVCNIQEGRIIPVGTITHSLVTIDGLVIFPGNVTQIPQNIQMSLVIGANFGIRNYNSINLVPQLYYNGAVLAVEQINTRKDILENFRMELFNFTAGVQVWDFQFAYDNVFPIRDKLGLAVISSFASDVSIQFTKLLLDLNISKVLVGSANTVDDLSSKSQFPMYVRTIVPDRYTVNAYIQMFKYFGFKRCGLFVSSDLSGRMFRSTFLEMAQENDIQVINNPEMQLLPSPLPNIDTLRNCTANFQNLIDSRAQILLITMIDGAILAVDFLYEMGIRGGDIQFVANKWLSPSIIASNDTETSRRRSELLRGAIQFALSGFSGEFGAKVKSDFLYRFSEQPDLRSCFFYDSALALAYALEVTIQIGKDFTDSVVLNAALRGTKFKGCSGVVYFSSDTNDRTSMSYDVLNAITSDNDTQLKIIKVGAYDPTSALMFNFTSDIIWSDGTTKVPHDIRLSSINCPFEDRLIRPCPSGQRQFTWISTSIFLVAAISSIIFTRLFWNHLNSDITEKRRLQLLDMLAYLTISIEALQYIYFAPSHSQLPIVLQGLSSAVMIDFRHLVSYNDGGYTILLIFILSVVSLWLFFVTFLSFRIDFRWSAVPGVEFLGTFSDVFVPLVSDWCFLPILSILLDVFYCGKVVRNEGLRVTYTGPYLEIDCYMWCWQDFHWRLVIITCIWMMLFLPTCICFRPVWQELQAYINIKSSGQHLMVKSTLQVLLPVASKNLRSDYTLCYKCLYFSLFLGYFAYAQVHKCWSYSRMRHWHRASIAMVTSTVAVAVLSDALPASPIIVAISCCACWVFIAIICLIYQEFRLPSFLFAEAQVDRKVLFKFAFQRTTNDLIAALRDSFQRVGHRNRVGPTLKVAIDRGDGKCATENSARRSTEN